MNVGEEDVGSDACLIARCASINQFVTFILIKSLENEL